MTLLSQINFSRREDVEVAHILTAEFRGKFWWRHFLLLFRARSRYEPAFTWKRTLEEFCLPQGTIL